MRVIDEEFEASLHDLKREVKRGPNCSFEEICNKEVINVCDGRRLGYVCNCEVDADNGCIVSIIVPGIPKLFGLLRGEKDYCITWRHIVKIGIDVILVDIDDRGGKLLD